MFKAEDEQKSNFLGTADVAPVVEIAARMPDIYLGCRLGFSEAKVHGQGWLHKNRWYLYSAYEDRRRNSLYPKLDVSIQVGRTCPPLQCLFRSWRPLITL